MPAEPSGISTFYYQTPVQYWCKWILYKLTLLPQSRWPLVSASGKDTPFDQGLA
jgi:hypothetical protein